MNYLFILGNHPELSIAEIKNLFNHLGIRASFLSVSTHVLQVNPVYPQKELYRVNTNLIIKDEFIDKLGGTIKIAKIFSSQKTLDSKIIVDKLLKANRNLFGISVYNFDFGKRDFINFCGKIKRELYEHDIKSNYIFPQKGQELSSVVSAKKLAKKGLEFIIAKYQNEYIYAKISQIQDFKKYSDQDYGIPCPDPKSGMLPPKLAQIMINLSLPELSVKSVSEKSVVFYDPFCGRGRIILQALNFGFEIYGSDIDKNAIEGTKKNIKWLAAKFNIKLLKDFYSKNVFIQDATCKINLKNQLVDAIITEPHLGPSHRKNPTEQEIAKIFLGLEKLYLSAFGEFISILKPDAKIVFIFPKIGSQSLLEILVDKILKMGYHKLTSFIYARSYQIVKREIAVFKFQK